MNMTNNNTNLYDLPKNSKRILYYLEFDSYALPRGEVTIANVGKELGLTKDQLKYAVNSLKQRDLVNTRPKLGNMNTHTISINADTVERSDIKEMIL